jgi:hypothetical protein
MTFGRRQPNQRHLYPDEPYHASQLFAQLIGSRRCRLSRDAVEHDRTAMLPGPVVIPTAPGLLSRQSTTPVSHRRSAARAGRRQPRGVGSLFSRRCGVRPACGTARRCGSKMNRIRIWFRRALPGGDRLAIVKGSRRRPAPDPGSNRTAAWEGSHECRIPGNRRRYATGWSFEPPSCRVVAAHRLRRPTLLHLPHVFGDASHPGHG